MHYNTILSILLSCIMTLSCLFYRHASWDCSIYPPIVTHHYTVLSTPIVRPHDTVLSISIVMHHHHDTVLSIPNVMQHNTVLSIPTAMHHDTVLSILLLSQKKFLIHSVVWSLAKSQLSWTVQLASNMSSRQAGDYIHLNPLTCMCNHNMAISRKLGRMIILTCDFYRVEFIWWIVSIIALIIQDSLKTANCVSKL